MRTSSAIFACLLASVLLFGASGDDSYWRPTEEDLKAVTKVQLLVPQSCRSALFQEIKLFLGEDYFQYPEQNFKAVWVDGDPWLKFFSAEGVIREISLVRYNRDDIVSILHHWGFKKDEDAAREYRTKVYSASQAPKASPAPRLELDENGNVVFPAWFTTRENKIAKGELDPFYREYLENEETVQRIIDTERELFGEIEQQLPPHDEL